MLKLILCYNYCKLIININIGAIFGDVLNRKEIVITANGISMRANNIFICMLIIIFDCCCHAIQYHVTTVNHDSIPSLH